MILDCHGAQHELALLANNAPLTFPPFLVCLNKFIHQGHIFKPFSLRLSHDFWIAAFVGPEKVQIKNHDSTLLLYFKKMLPGKRYPEPEQDFAVMGSDSVPPVRHERIPKQLTFRYLVHYIGRMSHYFIPNVVHLYRLQGYV